MAQKNDVYGRDKMTMAQKMTKMAHKKMIIMAHKKMIMSQKSDNNGTEK